MRAMRMLPLVLLAACTHTRYELSHEEEGRLRRLMDEQIAQANVRLQLTGEQRPAFRQVIVDSAEERRAVLLKYAGEPRTSRNSRKRPSRTR